MSTLGRLLLVEDDPNAAELMLTALDRSTVSAANAKRRLPLFQGVLPFNKSTLPGDIICRWLRLSTRRRAATDFRVDDAAFGDQRLRSLSQPPQPGDEIPWS